MGSKSVRLRPKGRLERWCAGEFWFEIGLAAVTAIYGACATIRYSNLGERDLAVAHGVGFLSATLLLVLRAVIRNRQALENDSAHGLDGVLHTLYSILHERTSESKKASLRICVFGWSGDKNNEMVCQLTDYVGDSPQGGSGREMPLRLGVVGTAFRTGESQYDKLPKQVNVTDYLAQNHGYQRTEAAQMKQDRQAWAAIPVGEPGHVVAVIFLDTNSPNFFGNSNSPVRQILKSAILGVAKYVEKP